MILKKCSTAGTNPRDIVPKLQKTQLVKTRFNSLVKIVATLTLAGIGFIQAADQSLNPSPSSGRWVLRSAKQADKWQDAFVTGNGKHGMMVMGNSLSERITQVHEELFLRAWDRSIVGVPNIARHLGKQRQLIADGKNNEAMFVYSDAIAQAKAAGAGATWELTPHPAFDLHLDHLSPGGLLAYANQLDLESGEASCRWQRSNAAVEQRVFSSRIANVNVVSLKATHGKKLNLTLSLGETPGRSGMHLGAFHLDTAFTSVTNQSEPGWLTYRAKYALDSGGYEGLARVTHVGGSMVKVGNALTLTDADELLVLVRISPLADGSTSVKSAVKTELAAMPTDYAQLLKPHAAQHGEMFGRVKLDLGAASEWQTKTTQEMLRHVAEKGLSAHYLEAVHAMGRYLLISSCGRYPPPLRGIWGGDWKADWAGGFVLDTNLDLAMSAAGPGNLPECIESYAGYIERQLPGWRLNATNTLGTRGFVAASFANPETGYQTHKNPVHWYYICQAGWHLRPLYDYALLSKNDKFMKERVLPLYLEMADFYQDYMVADANGVLHITPGCSPESSTPKPYNTQIADDSTIDLAVAREVYQVLIEQGPKFGIPPAQITEWKNIRNKIAPYRIDSKGTLAEWAPEKYTVTNYGSRHNSHLYPIFPGHEFFQPGTSAGLLEAARAALQKRIETEHLRLSEELSGHGILYAAMMSSRLREVKNVHKLLNHIARNGFQYDSMFTSHCPNGRYYNMDVAGSLTRLLMEMLVFSHPGNIDLMPGWNAELPAGSCSGMLVRGGHKIDIAWAGGAMTSAVLHAGANETLTVRFRDQTAPLTVKSGQQYELKKLFSGTLQLPSIQVIGLSNSTGNGCSPSQTIEKSFDSDINTKWCASHGGKPVIWQMLYAAPPAEPLRAYSFTSAEDVPGRDPIRWTLEGSQDGASWTVLDERELGAPFARRAMKKNFGIANTVSYRTYRFVFQPSATESMFQVAEVALDFTGANPAPEPVQAK